MSMTSCPGCGLPRTDDQIGTVACPVCAVEAISPIFSGPIKKQRDLDPTATMPIDVAELNRVAGDRRIVSRGLITAVVFLLGSMMGVAVVLGWQAIGSWNAGSDPRVQPGEEVATGLTPSQLQPAVVEVAPMPREPAPPPPEEAPLPRAIVQPFGTTRVIVLEINEPEETYTLPSTLRKAEKVILRGKVKKLNLSNIINGSVIDASGLEAATISITGRIDERSTVKVFSPGGQVSMNAMVTGNATVEIRAPGGEVKLGPAKGSRVVSHIDGGSKVLITADSVDLRGDVNGINTCVTIEIPSTGLLRVAAVRGIATVEYRVVGDKGEPEVESGIISPTANLRRIE